MARFDNDRPKSATASSTGAATNAEIVAAVTDKRIRVKKLILNSSAATDWDLISGSTTIFSLKSVKDFAIDDAEALNTNVGENLNYTTTAGNSEVYVEYYDS